MGDSMPPPAEFDLVDSYARRRDADVEIVLADPKAELVDSGVAVRLRRAKQIVDVEGKVDDSATGRRLTVRVPRNRLSDGIWALRLGRPDGSFAPLAARLLVQGERPVVLLWGAKGSPTEVPVRRRAEATAHITAAGSRALDRIVSVLPEQRALQLRRQVRGTARRLLG